MEFDFLGGAREAGAAALGAGEVEIGEELHLYFFETISGAALTATGTGVEGKVAGREFANLGSGRE